MNAPEENRNTHTRQVMLALGYFDPRFVTGVAAFAQEHGWNLSMEAMHSRKIPWGWKGDGIISKLYEDGLLTRFVLETGVPVVNIGRGDGVQIPLVMVDEGSLAECAFEHFHRRGFTSFAFAGSGIRLAPTTPQPIGIPTRGEQFSACVAKAGFACASLGRGELPSPESPTWGDNQARLTAAIAELPRPVAILCEDDHYAARVVRACLSANLSIPGDVAILGVNNDPFVCETPPITISSIDTNMELRAHTAAQLLQDLMDGKSIANQTLVPVKGATTRASTNTIVVPHKATDKALKYIWNHHAEPITIKSIAEQAGLSSRALHKNFIRFIGRSPIHELHRVQLVAACHLLATTELSIDEVAARSGHENLRNLYRAFSKSLNTTPRRYRVTRRSETNRRASPLFSRNPDE